MTLPSLHFCPIISPHLAQQESRIPWIYFLMQENADKNNKQEKSEITDLHQGWKIPHSAKS